MNIASLEQVVKEYLALAEAKTEAARKKSAQAVLETTMIDDLDQVSSIQIYEYIYIYTIVTKRSKE